MASAGHGEEIEFGRPVLTPSLSAGYTPLLALEPQCGGGGVLALCHTNLGLLRHLLLVPPNPGHRFVKLYHLFTVPGP